MNDDDKILEMVKICRFTPKGKMELQNLLDAYSRAVTDEIRLNVMDEILVFFCNHGNKLYSQGREDEKMNSLKKHMKK